MIKYDYKISTVFLFSIYKYEKKNQKVLYSIQTVAKFIFNF